RCVERSTWSRLQWPRLARRRPRLARWPPLLRRGGTRPSVRAQEPCARSSPRGARRW
ncbi:unnamed protein product, partial [Prorocentrum cordatum]